MNTIAVLTAHAHKLTEAARKANDEAADAYYHLLAAVVRSQHPTAATLNVCLATEEIVRAAAATGGFADPVTLQRINDANGRELWDEDADWGSDSAMPCDAMACIRAALVHAAPNEAHGWTSTEPGRYTLALQAIPPNVAEPVA